MKTFKSLTAAMALVSAGVCLAASPAQPPHSAASGSPSGHEVMSMIPGQVITAAGSIEINVGLDQLVLEVANTGDRPIQVGSHYHFYETNAGLSFDREKTRGMRLDIAAGTAVRFEPGQAREVRLVPIGGDRQIYGFRQKVMGAL